MKTFLTIFVSVILSLVANIFFFGHKQTDTTTLAKETTYDRVMRTGMLRCGYFSWPPYMSKNLKTGEFEGFFYDYVQGLARHMNIKVEWTAEVLYGNVVQEIRSGKIDAFCAGMWPTANLAKYLDFSIPINFNGVYAVVRADDTRFDGDLARINNPKIRIVSMEGSIGTPIARTQFPNATLSETSMVAGASSPFIDVVMNKADVVFVDPLLFETFISSNPNKLKRVANVPPTNVWGNAIAFGKNEEALISAIDITTREMLHGGEIDRIIKRYGLNSKDLYPVADPYILP